MVLEFVLIIVLVTFFQLRKCYDLTTYTNKIISLVSSFIVSFSYPTRDWDTFGQVIGDPYY